MSYQAFDMDGNDVTARDRLKCASTPTLRDALETRGLPVSGTKAQMAQRLLDIGMTAERLEDEHGWRARESRREH